LGCSLGCAELVREREPAAEPLDANALKEALAASTFLSQHIYGGSRMLPLTALLQRQFRPTAPLPYRRDALLIQEPGWFDARVTELEQLQLQRELDARLRDLERLQRALDILEEDQL